MVFYHTQMGKVKDNFPKNSTENQYFPQPATVETPIDFFAAGMIGFV